MEIIGTETTGTVKAHVLASTYGLTIDEARQLKRGTTIEVAPEIAARLVKDGLAKEV